MNRGFTRGYCCWKPYGLFGKIFLVGVFVCGLAVIRQRNRAACAAALLLKYFAIFWVPWELTEKTAFQERGLNGSVPYKTPLPEGRKLYYYYVWQHPMCTKYHKKNRRIRWGHHAVTSRNRRQYTQRIRPILRGCENLLNQ
jgi:hypothetical protein